MKHLLLGLYCLVGLAPAFGQSDKPITISATARFNAVVEGLATNDAGYGVGVDVAFFSQHRVQLLVESSWDRFIGDKLLVVDPASGKEARKAAVYALSLGPRFGCQSVWPFQLRMVPPGMCSGVPLIL